MYNTRNACNREVSFNEFCWEMLVSEHTTFCFSSDRTAAITELYNRLTITTLYCFGILTAWTVKCYPLIHLTNRTRQKDAKSWSGNLIHLELLPLQDTRTDPAFWPADWRRVSEISISMQYGFSFRHRTCCFVTNSTNEDLGYASPETEVQVIGT
jgi:hypothetical protein